MQTSQLYLIDTHCHLYASEFDADRPGMIKNAIEAGVQKMMLPNIDLGTVELMTGISQTFPDNCFPMLGLHPCSVKENYQEELERMKNILLNGNYIGIGETGVDLYWDTTTRDLQINAFEQQINWAKERALPVIIHSRESLDLNIDIIRNQQDGNLKGIFHCFGGTYEQAVLIYELGFKIGIGGIVTFKKNTLEEVLPDLPPEIIVLETDAPYLAPVPFRGKRNESSYLVLIARKVSEVLGIDIVEVGELTTGNALEVFRKKG